MDILTKAGQGEAEALSLLWNRVQRFVYSQARRFKRLYSTEAELDELVNEAFLYLQRAAQTHDPERGSFLTWYAFYLKRAFLKAAGVYTGKQDPLKHYISLDKEIPGTDDLTLSDTIADEKDHISAADERIYIGELREALDEALDKLPQKFSHAIDQYYFQNQTFKGIADYEQISSKAARDRVKSGLRMLRKDQTLMQKTDAETPFYLFVGLGTYKSTHTSAVELIAEIRERIERGQQKKQKSAFGLIR